MVSRSAKAKLKAILVIDLIIVAVAAGIFLYLQNAGQLAGAPKEAKFTVTDLTISPLEVEIGENVTVSANVTNIGEIDGSYLLNLTINDVLKENQTILLTRGASKIVELTAGENVEGNYTVKIGNLSEAFKIIYAPKFP